MTTASQTKGRRGRGLDALFGGATGSQSPDIDADLAALLDDEVVVAESGRHGGAAMRGGSDGPGAGDGVPAEAIDVPPLAAEAAPVDPAASAASEPPAAEAAPVAQQPDTPAPTTKRIGAIVMETAPAPAAGDAAVVAADELTGRAAPPGPGVEAIVTSLPALAERTGDEKAIVVERLDKVLDRGWQKALHQQIDALYKEVATKFSSPPAKSEQALGMLREARQLLIDSPEEYVSAEYRTAQVRAMLDRMLESRKQSLLYGPRLLAYEGAWLLALLAALIFAGPLARLITTAGAIDGPALANVYPIINTMVWGGIGGVVGALYTLWWHMASEQDFDRNYLMWYLVQPLMGMVLGGIVFLLLAAGFLIIQVNLTDSSASAGARLVPYLAAVLAGFRQNFVYEQFDRLMSLFTPNTSKENGGG